MKHHLKKRAWLAASLVTASLASGQDAGTDLPPGLNLEMEQKPLKNRFGLSYRPGFNISASFRRLGFFAPQTNPGPSTGPADRFYDDGYVRPDSGTAPGLTWFWGYENNSQVPGDNTIQYHSSSSPGTGSSDDNDGNPQQGIELSYDRYLGKVGKRASWGLGAAFNYNNVTIEDDSPVVSSVQQLTDTYGLGGVIPPEAPYNGTFAGPGPLIGDSRCGARDGPARFQRGHVRRAPRALHRNSHRQEEPVQHQLQRWSGNGRG
jgi:hypothetical protein